MTLADSLRAAGYFARREELLALGALGHQRGVRALLLEGPPGVGKTALPAAYAQVRGAELVYGLLHSWSDDQELFAGVDVVAAVAGQAERVHRPGLLAIAARASQEREVVLCLDELDKAPERVESLLLDALQTGRVPVRPGEHLQLRAERVTVFATSNGARDLTDAFLRRCTRVRMRPLPVAQQDELIAGRCPVSRAVITCLGKLAREVALAERNDALSLDELTRLCSAAWAVAESADDLRMLLAQHAARQHDGVVAASKAQVSAAWGELVAARRGIRRAA